MLLLEPLWTLIFPDLRRLPRNERRTAIRYALAAASARRGRKTLAGWSAGMVAFVAMAALATARSVTSFSLILVIGIAALWLMYPLELWWCAVNERSLFRRHIRRQMTELGHPACIECGYDLRAASGQRCSECGHPLPLMRFRISVRLLNDDAPANWEVTALSAEHARTLLLDRLALEHRGGGQILSVQQVVSEHIERSGSVDLSSD
jgi:hypothetical protein